jgi:hypothetical protein
MNALEARPTPLMGAGMNPGGLRKSLMFRFKHTTKTSRKQRPPGFVI